jgi:hypothetical protein
MRSFTDKQIEASRKNGALSRGPVTPEGKKRASKNALRHGMFAREIVLDNEPKQNFTHITKRLRKQFRPDNEAENQLIDQLAASSWRLRRFWAMETGMLNQSMPDHGMPNQNVPGEPSLDYGFRPPDAGQLVDILDGYTAGINCSISAFTSLAPTPHFRLLFQYQERLQRDFQRALRGLMQLQDKKKNKN